MGKRGPQPKPEERKIVVCGTVSPEAGRLFRQIAPPTGKGKNKEGVRSPGDVLEEMIFDYAAKHSISPTPPPTEGE